MSSRFHLKFQAPLLLVCLLIETTALKVKKSIAGPQDFELDGEIASEDRWQVCKGGCGNAPAMWFDGGIHANEWIGPAVATFMARWISF